MSVIGSERFDRFVGIDGAKGVEPTEQGDDPSGALHVASLALCKHGGEFGLCGGSRDQRVDDVTAVLEDRPRDARRSWPPPRDGSSDSAAPRARAAMPASSSIRSLSGETSSCFEPALSYTVWAETPAALAMSRTLVRA